MTGDVRCHNPQGYCHQHKDAARATHFPSCNSLKKIHADSLQSQLGNQQKASSLSMIVMVYS